MRSVKVGTIPETYFWNALLGVRLGLEIAQGRRINKDDSFGRATRIGFIFYADF
ncbi:MAG: hypothetical protein MZV64_06935 [Ignavibacteriales bacterium]|nr:hypothetical protein [Ignavibacteriales bacterium]